MITHHNEKIVDKSNTAFIKTILTDISSTPFSIVSLSIDPKKPSFSSIAGHHDCLNETDPHFDTYTDGIVRLKTKDFLPKQGETVTITFSYKGNSFYSYTETPPQELSEIYLFNMPFGEDITIKVSSSNKDSRTSTTKELSCKIDKKHALYEVGGQKRSRLLQNQVLLAPRGVGPTGPRAFPMSSHELSNPLSFTIDSEGSLSYATSRKYTLTNNSPFKNMLIFEICDSQTKRAISVPIIINPKETKNLTQEFFTMAWKDAYRTRLQAEPPSENDLRIFYVEHRAFGIPSANIKNL